MNIETSKIQLDISEEKIYISDRMPIKFVDITIFLVLTLAIAIFILGVTGIIYSLLFSIGYILFRYFAWVIWKKIEIDLDRKKITITHMLLNNARSTNILTDKFDFSNLELNEFEQSGMKRAMIQYKNHKNNDLLLLTHPKDIEIIKNELMNKKVANNGNRCTTH